MYKLTLIFALGVLLAACDNGSSKGRGIDIPDPDPQPQAFASFVRDVFDDPENGQPRDLTDVEPDQEAENDDFTDLLL